MSLGRGPSGTLGGHSTVSSPLSVPYRERTPFRLHLSSSLAIISSARDMCSVRRALSFLLPGRLRLLVLSPQAPRELQHFSHFPCTFLALSLYSRHPLVKREGTPRPLQASSWWHSRAWRGRNHQGAGGAGSWAALALGLSFGLSIKFRCLYYDKF